MITKIVNAEERGNISRPRAADRRAEVPSSPKCKILLGDYRDEVFVRLEADLREMGHSVLRATGSDEIRQLYGQVSPDLVLCHHDLSGRSGWIAAARLQMYYATARVWLYVPWKSSFDSTWVKISGVEAVIYYRGDLFRLADEVVKRMGYFGPKPSRIGRNPLHRKSTRPARLRTG